MKRYKFRTSFTFNGKRYQVTANTESELEAKVALKKQSLERNTVEYSGDMTVRKWAEYAVPVYKTGQADVTRKKYLNRMNHCILDQIGNMKLRMVLPITLQSVLNLQKGKSKRHINEIYQQIRFLFRTAKENGLIDTDPSENLVKPQGTKGTHRSLTEEERSAFLKVTEDDRFILFLLMFYCGLRPSEAREAMGKDIFTNNGKTFLQVRGTKTENANRVVPIPDILYDRIKSTKSDAYIADHNGKFSDTAYYRLTKRLYREMNLIMGAKLYRNQIVEEALAKDFTPYCLRHTYCSDLAKNGVDIRTAQKLMGHSDITLTANIYTHVDNDTLLSAWDIINGSHTGSRTPKEIDLSTINTLSVNQQ